MKSPKKKSIDLEQELHDEYMAKTTDQGISEWIAREQAKRSGMSIPKTKKGDEDDKNI